MVSGSHSDQMPETFKYDNMHLTGYANARPAPITKEAATECRGWTLGLLGLVDKQRGQVQKSRVLSCLRVRVVEARFSLLGYHVTLLSWTGSTGSLGCARMGRTGPLTACWCHSQSFALVNTHSCLHLHKSELHDPQLPSLPPAGRAQSAIQALLGRKPLSVNHHGAC